MSQDFFDYIEDETTKDVEDAVQRFHCVGPLLIKMEGVVVNTSTGRAPQMRNYYKYWETKIFDTITKVGGLLHVLFQL